MDEIQDYITGLYSLYSRHSSTIGTVTSTLSRITNVFQTYFYPPLDRLFRTLANKPDVASVILLIVLLFVSLKLLNLLYQAVMWWVRLVTRLVIWGSLIAIVAWVVSRGPEGVIADVNSLISLWRGEYRYWSARDGDARTANAASKAFGQGYDRVRAWT